MDQIQAVRAVIHIYGVVQGVGFRPFVARLAREHRMAGYVRNVMGHVVIEAAGSQDDLELFVRDIQARKPAGSQISRMDRHTQGMGSGENLPRGFAILESGETGEGPVMPTPDLAICGDCLRELYSPRNPRFGNPFISCTRCGPRFSIMRRIPYDRINTSMDGYPLCRLCAAQYADPEDRRYHAQTVCCNDCGPVLLYKDRDTRQEGGGATEMAAKALMRGEIIAVKGIGGYHFACSPFDEQAILRLRELKGREHKPFAVMFPGLDALKAYCHVSLPEEDLLTGSPRPIVLLQRRDSLISPNVYTSSPYIGAFLPYTPLQHLILDKTGPLIMTSANVTSLPIIKDDEEMLAFFREHEALGGVMYHDREIKRRLDDSVAAVILGEARLIRRARGYVPMSFPLAAGGPALLACGSQEKNTVCLYRDGFAYPFAETGGLFCREALDIYRDTVADMQELMHIAPELAVCDMHPGYESTQYAKSLGIPVLEVQHHHAHIASVMAEHGLADTVIGVAFDGTGYGTDNTVWGGEFLIVSPEGFTRVGHIKAEAFLGGDESVRQGWKSAACLMRGAGLGIGSDSRHALVRAALAHGVNTIRSSSMGRIFDAVSSILGICHESRYDGQCAIDLENAAARHTAFSSVEQGPFPFDLKEEDGLLIADLAPCIREICALKERGGDACALAWRFHITVRDLIIAMCGELFKRYGIRKTALSGGVFQNRILVESTVPKLEQAGFEVYLNRNVPAGDGGISLGQAYVGLHHKRRANSHVHCGSRKTD